MTAMQCGAARVDITPNVGLPMAGYSTSGPVSSGVRGHLFARALYAEDDRGEAVALVIADLHAGTRYLSERAAEITSAIGIGIDRLVLCGTHTHNGPGNLYGNTLYDRFSQSEAGLDERLGDWVSERIALAIQRAHHARRASRIGFDRRPVWGISRNRSAPAFDNNPSAGTWGDVGRPGHGWTGDPADPGAKVDPRLSLLSVVDDSDGRLMAVFGFFGCHTTALGMNVREYSPDWAGHACRRATWELERHGDGSDVIVALGPGAAGDVNALRDHTIPPWTQGPTLAHKVGLQMGREIAAAARDAAAGATARDITCLFAEPTTESGVTHPQADARLADEWLFGVAGLAGAEDGRTPFYHLGLADEPATGDTEPPQAPKAKAGGVLQDLLKDVFDLAPSDVLPLRAVRIGEHWLVTVPGEPTAHSAADIEDAIGALEPDHSVIVVGYSGDYMGYFPTAAEYDLQHYEGGSALFGKNSARHVQARLGELVSGGVTPPMTPRPIDFDVPTRESRFVRPEDIRPSGTDPRPRIDRTGVAVHVWWDMGWDDVLPFADGWMVRVEEEVAPDDWQPLSVEGRELNDVEADLRITRNGTFAPGLGSTLWHANIRLPGGPAGHGTLRVRVRAVHDFPGFTIPIRPA